MDQLFRIEEINHYDLIREFESKYKTLWWETPTVFPSGLPVYERAQQLKREKSLQQFIGKLNQKVKSFPESESLRPIWMTDIKKMIFEFCKESPEWDDNSAAHERCLPFLETFSKIAEEFTVKAKEFDPQINMDDIVQAARNVWTMNSIQIIFSQTARLTPPIFAYSLLYPYTDNYLDSPDISLSLKKENSLRLKKRLQGYTVTALNYNENKVFDLLNLIEEYYPRDIYPDVYDSLYAIHHAQIQSLLLQKGKNVPYETDIMGISFLKGGASVLADGFLINGKLNREEADFSFAYGVLLQLIDDLKDTCVDAENGHMTLFSQLVRKWPLDILTNRLFNFSECILNVGDRFLEPHFKVLLKKNLSFLIMEAIAQNSDFYSGDYLKKLAVVLPLRLNYLRKLKPRLKKLFSPLNYSGIGMPVNSLIRSGVALHINIK